MFFSDATLHNNVTASLVNSANKTEGCSSPDAGLDLENKQTQNPTCQTKNHTREEHNEYSQTRGNISIQGII